MAGRSWTEAGGADRRFDEFDNVAMPDALRGKLAAHHYRMLAHDSRIADDVIAARGYRTVSDRKDLKALGFTGAQLTLSGLVIPLHDVNGDVFAHQLRPDVPREEKRKPGKFSKYEYTAGYKPRIDIPPSVRGVLPDPRFPLWICEGVRKVDALVSAGVHAIAIGSVTLWRGTGPEGGVTALPCWESIALRDREVVVGFDSDTASNLAVWKQADRFGRWLESRGADVRFLHLPDAQNDTKQGVDDFLAAGHIVDDLRALVCDTLPPKPAPKDTLGERGDYRVRTGCVERLVENKYGALVPVALSNFGAQIVEEIETRDSGVVVARSYRLDVHIEDTDEPLSVEVEAEAFAKDAVGWVERQLGARATLAPIPADRAHFIAALKLCSKPSMRVVYPALGWELIEGEWRYCHLGGAIGRDGNDPSVEVRIDIDKFRNYVLPDPTHDVEELRACWTATGDLRGIAPQDPVIGITLLAAAYRAVFGPTPESVWFYGASGTRKSSAIACVQAHFGAGFWEGDRVLPASWRDTTNSIENAMHAARDALLPLDDFVLDDDPNAKLKLAREVLRSMGNLQGKGRMRAEGGARKTLAPRCTMISTSEIEPPSDEGLRARVLALSIDGEGFPLGSLKRCQEHAREGRYALMMSSFIAWLADDLPTRRAEFVEDRQRARAEVGELLTGTHARTSGAVATLVAALRMQTLWLQSIGVIDEDEAAQALRDDKAALVELGRRQAEMRRDADPAVVALEQWRAGFTSGSWYLEPCPGRRAPDEVLYAVGAERRGGGVFDQAPRGQRIGYVDGEFAYIEPDAGLNALKAEFRRRGESFTATRDKLGQRLLAAGLVIGERRGNGHADRPAAQLRVGGLRTRVFRIPLEKLLGSIADEVSDESAAASAEVGDDADAQ